MKYNPNREPTVVVEVKKTKAFTKAEKAMNAKSAPFNLADYKELRSPEFYRSNSARYVSKKKVLLHEFQCSDCRNMVSEPVDSAFLALETCQDCWTISNSIKKACKDSTDRTTEERKPIVKKEDLTF